MPESKSVQVQAWLNLLCRMIPGISQAMVQIDSDQLVQWPQQGVINDDVISSAELAASQKKTVTTTLASTQSVDEAVEMIIAMPLNATQDFTLTVAILVKIKPAQQALVMQMLKWGEAWLQLILHQQDAKQVDSRAESESAQLLSEQSFFQSHKSRFIIAGILLLLVLLSIINGTYRVTAPASLEGKIQRVIVAPFDGYIDSAFARAGETVKAGDIIARLDNQELVLQQQRYAAEMNEYSRQYRKSLAMRDKAQAHIFKSQLSQAEAQLKLLDKKIHRSSLIAPLDGIIISGDLSRSLGAAVETGDVLFEVAPLNEYRLIIFVDEKQVVDVRQGMNGLLTLKALPAEELAFIVDKVSPVFEENTDGIAYRVEARFEQNHSVLRPGMQGQAKIEIDQRSYIWIYMHELYDVIRLWLWRWMP